MGNSSGDLGCLLYLNSIFNALQSVPMTLDNRLISVHSVILSLAHSSHTLEPSPKPRPALRVTICSVFLESPDCEHSVLLPNQLSDHMLHIFFGEICSLTYASVP